MVEDLVLYFQSQNQQKCPLLVYWRSFHEVILENDWEDIKFGKEELSCFNL